MTLTKKPVRGKPNLKSLLKEIHSILKNACKLSVKAAKKSDAIQIILLIKNEVNLINNLLDKHGFRHPQISLNRWSGDDRGCFKLEQDADETIPGAWGHLPMPPEASDPEREMLMIKGEPDPIDEWKPEVANDMRVIKSRRLPEKTLSPEIPLIPAKFHRKTRSPESDEEVPSLTEASFPSPDDDMDDNSDFAETLDGGGKQQQQQQQQQQQPAFADDAHIVEKGYCKLCDCQLKTMNTSEEQVIDHMVRIHPERAYQCECGVFLIGPQIKGHVRMHKNASASENSSALEGANPDESVAVKTFAVKKLIPDSACIHCGLQFLSPEGLMTAELRYFWVERGDTNFVKSHLAKCSRSTKSGESTKGRCHICRAKPTQNQLLRHYVEKHIHEMVQCEQCPEWHTKQTISTHKSRKHTKPAQKMEEERKRAAMIYEYDCDFCLESVCVERTDNLEDARRVHMRGFHTNEILRCDCGVDIYGFEDKEKHVLVHAECKVTKLVDLVKKPECPTCDYEFLDSRKNMSSTLKYFWFEKKDERFVDSHLEACVATRSYRRFTKCHVCGKEVQRYLMHRHMLECHMEKLCQCKDCGQWFLKNPTLGRHRIAVHGVAPRPQMKVKPKKVKDEPFHAVCSTCGENFSDKLLHRKHESKHKYKNNRKKLVKCQICHEMVPYLTFSAHEMGHLDFEDGQPRTCEFCGSNFTKVQAFKDHVRKHKQKIYMLQNKVPKEKEQCSICSKWVTCVKQHFSFMHTDRERYPCDECGKTFAEKRFLERHKTLHTELFRFKCRFCSKGYNVKCALEYHEDTVHTKIKRYICPVPECGEAFFVNLYLRKHMKKFHP